MTRQQCEDLDRRIEAISKTASSLFERYSPARLACRPAASSWSAAECIAHLNLTAGATVPAVENAIAELQARGVRDERPSRMDWFGRFLRWSLEPPPRFRVRTTAPFEPQPVDAFDGVLPAFLEWQKRATATVRSSEGLDLASIKITSPFNSRVRYNVLSAFWILETHERRHLWQAERVISGAGRDQQPGQ